MKLFESQILARFDNNNFLWVCWFLAKNLNLSNFVSFPLNLTTHMNNAYCIWYVVPVLKVWATFLNYWQLPGVAVVVMKILTDTPLDLCNRYRLRFFIKLGIKPPMHLLEIGIFSIYHVIVRPTTKIFNNLCKVST